MPVLGIVVLIIHALSLSRVLAGVGIGYLRLASLLVSFLVGQEIYQPGRESADFPKLKVKLLLGTY